MSAHALLDKSTFKSLKTPCGHTYTYYARAPSAGKPYILYCHGFPEDSSTWVSQVSHFESKGYGTIAPDLLGNGTTSAPADPSEYGYKSASAALVAILDGEGIEQVVVVGHDFGVTYANRLVLFYPHRVTALVQVSVAYFPPRRDPFDLEAINRGFEATTGGRPFAYWEFFLKQDAGEVMKRNVDSVISLIFASDLEKVWRENLMVAGKTEEWITRNTTGPVGDYFTADKAARLKANVAKNGFPLNCYRVHLCDVYRQDTAEFTEEQKIIRVPTLQIVALRDPVSTRDGVGLSKAFIPDLTVRDVDAGHWAHIEKPQEVNSLLEEFLREKGL